jgi:AraC family transcriptional regulator, regulatory protein of adaptative response / methylated-DNA-[protein]-cysteine methyltransferase
MHQETSPIRYAIRPCWLGSLLVAGSDVGLTAVLLGDDADALVRELRSRSPEAMPADDDVRFARVVAAVACLVESPASRSEVPLAPRGTVFEQRVWEALREIPAGATATYSEIAARIDAPGTSREVGEACAANPLAVVVPCHRVVRKNGGLGGYRWGPRRKRALLAREAAAGRRAS